MLAVKDGVVPVHTVDDDTVHVTEDPPVHADPPLPPKHAVMGVTKLVPVAVNGTPEFPVGGEMLASVGGEMVLYVQEPPDVGALGDVTLTLPVPADPAPLVHEIVVSLVTEKLEHATPSRAAAVAPVAPALSDMVVLVPPVVGPVLGLTFRTADCANCPHARHEEGDSGDVTLTAPGLVGDLVPAGSTAVSCELLMGVTLVSATPSYVAAVAPVAAPVVVVIVSVIGDVYTVARIDWLTLTTAGVAAGLYCCARLYEIEAFATHGCPPHATLTPIVPASV